LEKIKNLLNAETIIGYAIDDTPVTKSQFIEDIKEVDKQIETGTLKTYSSDEVRQQILRPKKQ